VDDFLTRNKDARRKIREVHPEVCFWALARGKAMLHSKQTSDGFENRKKILGKYYRQTENLVNYILKTSPRNQVKRDDILDALAAAVTAASGLQNLLTLPENPDNDARGFPMEMLYRRFDGFVKSPKFPSP
jgi:predicted RNase H-like nuclease